MKEMAMVFCILKMGGIMRANGRMIKCKDLVNCIMITVKLLTRAIGIITSSMDKDGSIAQNH
jgi:hypothetical protein